MLIALLIVNFFSGYFLRPLLKLSAMAARVETGDYPAMALSGSLNDEISVLSNNFGQMIAGLREKAAMRDYLRADLFEHAAAEQKIVAERADVTVLFAGIRDFSILEDQLSPEESVGLMSRFLEICETSVKEHGGDIDKYIGDTAMAAFKHSAEEVAERQALLAALSIQNRVAQLKLALPAFAGLHTGVGLASGPVIAGHIGSLNNRLDYTFIGDTVNLAARLEKMAGRKGTPGILTTQALYQKAGSAFAYEKLPPVTVKGKAMPVEVVAITGHDGEVPA
jgi:adenylate cyclase